MISLASPSRGSAFQALRLIARTSPSTLSRALSTLPNNPHIYIHPDHSSSQNKPSYILSYLPTNPPTPSLAIGHSTRNPPTPDTFKTNPSFISLLHTVLAAHAVDDPGVRAQAQVYVATQGSTFGFAGSGGGAGGGGGAAGGGGRGGYIHVSDARNPPDYGRTAWPEDIFGSLEVDAEGRFVDGNGRYQAAGTYRVVTHEGVLGLSDYLRGKIVERLRELEGKMGGGG